MQWLPAALLPSLLPLRLGEQEEAGGAPVPSLPSARPCHNGPRQVQGKPFGPRLLLGCRGCNNSKKAQLINVRRNTVIS